MADFSLIPYSGFETVIWIDPSTATKSGRIGEVPIAPHRRLRKSARYVEIRAVLIDEEEIRADAALDSRPFKAWWAEAPDGGPPILQPNGSTAILRTFPTAIGHYVLCVRRRQGGGCLIHFDVDPPAAVT